MIRLLRVELRRLRWRRAVLLLVLTAVVVPVVVFVSMAYGTRPVSASEVEQARSEPFYAQELRQCTRRPDSFGVRAAEGCQVVVDGFASGRSTLDGESVLATGELVVVVTVLGLLMLLVGTTFAGHDWASGSMSNQLLFDPRRGRVWLAKAVAVGLVAAVVAGVVTVSFWLGTHWLLDRRALPTPDGLLGDGLEECARATGLVAALAVGGYALTMLLRSTVATVGIVFGVALVGGVLIALLGGDGSGRYQPQVNALAVVSNDATYHVSDEQACRDPRSQSPCQVEVHVDAVDGAIYSGILLVVVGAASVVSFRRRDVP